MEIDQIRNDIYNNFKAKLNEHGFGFQYAVLKTAVEFTKDRKSPWIFEVSEFPLNVKGFDTKIDFIFRYFKNPILLLAECKRSNPALSNWCFARAPYVHKMQIRFSHLLLERVQNDQADDLKSTSYMLNPQAEAYHIALEIKSDKAGDKHAKGRGAIEDACTQICRGLNGFVEYIKTNPSMIQEKEWVDIIPVIFTTADLWATDVDLSTADLVSGNINFNHSKFEKKNWIWFQYHISPSLRHELTRKLNPIELHEILDFEYLRSIAIVNSNGIKNFLHELDDFSNFIKSP